VGEAAAHAARMFFALWPDARARAGLMRAGRAMHRLLGGRLTREDSVHLTLVFLGEVALDRLPGLKARAAQVRFAPFVLRIERAGCWRHNNVGWVGPQATPAVLQRLVADLEQGLGEDGFAFDERPYAAHVTLLRKAHCKPLPESLPTIDWPVREFVLVCSELNTEGWRYSILGRWPAQVEQSV
jgi:2'-5' RNA ligase